MHYYTEVLDNGLRMIHLPGESEVFYCGFAIRAGSRDEFSSEFGLAHFVEHMLFKGTSHRKSWHILNRMENVGGELNAYTTKEDTFVYSIFMEEHFKRALELLTDILFHSEFPESEVLKEKEVILDEINSYKDSPSELIYDEFENILFQGHALGHNILGEEETLSTFTSASGLSFLERYYSPNNMVFFSMGRLPFTKIKDQVRRQIGDMPVRPVSSSGRIAPGAASRVHRRENMDTHQAHVVIGGRAYSMYDEKRVALFLLNNILGGPGMNSRLNLSLREKYGLVYNVDSSVTSYSDTGLFNIYFGTDPRHLQKAMDLVYRELNRLCKTGLTTSQLTVAKKQLRGQLGVSGDNKESLFLGLGKSYLYHNRYDMLQDVFRKIDKITASDLLAVANEILSPERLSSLVYE
ncbi:MAG: insulinase family protein [Tannerellaceae bacterium]|nr:insulinase family protein [Tannerellaceae bacterium]